MSNLQQYQNNQYSQLTQSINILTNAVNNLNFTVGENTKNINLLANKLGSVNLNANSEAKAHTKKNKKKLPGQPTGHRNGYLLFGIDKKAEFKKLGGIFDNNGQPILGADNKPIKATTHIAKLWNRHKGHEEDGFETKVDKNGKSKITIKWKSVRQPDDTYKMYKDRSDKDKIRYEQEMKIWNATQSKLQGQVQNNGQPQMNLQGQGQVQTNNLINTVQQDNSFNKPLEKQMNNETDLLNSYNFNKFNP